MRADSIKILLSANGWKSSIGTIDKTNVISILVPGFQQKRGSGLREDYLLIPKTITFASTKRLVVVVPAGELDELELGFQIGRIALPKCLKVLFLALAVDPIVDSILRRRMTTLTSLIKDRQIKASKKLAFRENWIQAVKEVWEEGDLLVCIDGYRASTSIFRRKDFAEYIVSALGIPVYALTGIQFSNESMQGNGWRELLIWASAIAIMFLFGFLQFYIDNNLDGAASTLFLSLSVIVEILLLWKLNLLG